MGTIGNPPGKPGNLGDRLNWETLLAHVDDGADLHIVSKDGDYQSRLNSNRPHHFLVEEWTQRKQGELVLHAELRPFLNVHFSDIKLSVDIEKRDAINYLVNSRSFSSTHNAVAELEPLVEALTYDEA